MITKVQENRLRRVARRQGYELHRSRVRDPRGVHFGLYQLTTADTATDWMTAEQVANTLQEPLEKEST